MNTYKQWCILSFVLLPLGSAYAVDRLIDGFPDLPKDARKVAERSVACNYFSGEFDGEGGERDKQVNAQLRKLRCARVTQDLQIMHSKYQKQPKVLAILKEAEE